MHSESARSTPRRARQCWGTSFAIEVRRAVRRSFYGVSVVGLQHVDESGRARSRRSCADGLSGLVNFCSFPAFSLGTQAATNIELAAELKSRLTAAMEKFSADVVCPL